MVDFDLAAASVVHNKMASHVSREHLPVSRLQFSQSSQPSQVLNQAFRECNLSSQQQPPLQPSTAADACMTQPSLSQPGGSFGLG